MIILRGLFPILVALILSFSTTLPGQGYQIEVSLTGLSNDTLILGEYFTSRMVPKDTIVLNKRGNGVFAGSGEFPGGLYLIYFSPTHYFDLLLGDDQKLKITADTSDLANSIKFDGSEDNRIFQEYKAYLQRKRGELENQKSLLANATTTDSTKIGDRQKQINLEMEDYMNGIGKDHSSLFVSDFVRATREPFPPEELLTGNKRHDDSIRYYYYRQHYFDHFDPFNIRLLHTPLYEGKIKNYINRAVVQHPDSLIVAVDFLLKGTRGKNDLYRYMLITLFNHFAESKLMGMDVVYFHIAEYYYIPDATWSSSDFIAKLKDNLVKNKPTLIGQKAPNLILREVPSNHFEMAAQDTAIKRDPHIGKDFLINNTESKYTILYFWEADCGHCKKSTPVLQEVHSRMKEKGVEVISVHVINTVEGKGAEPAGIYKPTLSMASVFNMQLTPGRVSTSISTGFCAL